MNKYVNKKPKEGSKTEMVLSYLIDNNYNGNINLKCFNELAQLLEVEYGVEFDRHVIGKSIRKFNGGGYIVSGKTSEDFGKIKLTGKVKKAKTKAKTKPKKAVEVETNTTFDSDEVIDLDRVQQLIKGGNFKSGWVKTEAGSFYVSADQSGCEETLKQAEEEIKKILNDEFWDVKYTKSENKEGKEGVVFITDLHIGALVEGLLKTPDYNKDIIKEKLLKAVDHINNMGFDKVHIMCLGDVIESYTGLNHKNTWKGLEIGGHGPTVIKTATNMLHEFFLSRIKNLEKINMIAGNHCRTTQSAEEETEGGVSNLVAWGLGLIGYDVTFDPKCLSIEVDGIQYILLHGDKGISKRPTKDIIWDFGKQGMFNFVAEGHLHSRIQRLSAGSRDKLQLVKDDSIDCRRQVMPSFFTGNGYSEDNLWFSNSGMVITCNNGEGKPIVLDIPL